ncbi:FAD-dependent oxidoreductase [Cellulomonas cellasea]|uniref:FAD-dependent pyridine nucleotide-disulfide oxidoreductase n=2 Tax=Cellulomonas cellasea TaxID=43670 RepID=A0A0A0B3C5_9CELL|nr:FAD-dependent oxidoreductase [Cellulomonas cellasea]KGM01330.1 FAD-dependent pyridine nucleotide-disulfide oxidoreductase [Cellulomonas cellasea DSM 20118]
MAQDDQQVHEFDVVVIGGGAVGENAADRAHRDGLSVVVVEEELVGGECSYWACMPSKALLRPGAVLEAARAVPGAAQAVTGTVDVAATLARRDEFTSHWDDHGQVEWLEGAGLALLRGRARFTGPRELALTGTDGGRQVVRARHAVVVATGSEPVVPDALATVRPWTSREVTSAEQVPGTLVVVGGGVVAVEMAVAYSDLGAQVTMLVRGSRVLPRAEPFASDEVGEALVKRGIDVRYGAQATTATRDEQGVHLTLGDGSRVDADEVLVATGRTPRTGDLGVDVLGLTPGEPLVVDDALMVTGVEGGWLFAAGDVTGRTATTHQGKYDARVVGDVVAARFSAAAAASGADGTDGSPGTGGGAGPGRSGATGSAAERERSAGPWSRYRASADHAAVPQVVFGCPEVAWVGRTEQEARDAGLDVRTVRYAIGSVAGASVAADGYAGTAQLVLDEQRGTIVGATFTGPDAAELLHAATIGVVGEVPLDRLWHAVPAYPTVSEVWLRLLETAGL